MNIQVVLLSSGRYEEDIEVYHKSYDHLEEFLEGEGMILSILFNDLEESIDIGDVFDKMITVGYDEYDVHDPLNICFKEFEKYVDQLKFDELYFGQPEEIEYVFGIKGFDSMDELKLIVKDYIKHDQ